MRKNTYQAILDALDLLASGKPTKTNGKITAVNLAKESGISNATLYRNFEDHPDIRETYETLRNNGIRLSEDAPETVEQACRLLKDEVRQLRSELAEVKRVAEKLNKLKTHQIQILWMDNNRLREEINRFSGGNVVELVVKKDHAAPV